MATSPFPSPRRFAGVPGLALAAALGLAACGPSTAEQVEKLRPEAEAVFARIAALAPVVHDTPPVSSDGFNLRGASVRLDGDDSNALLIPAAHVGAPQHTRADGTGSTHALPLQYCGEAVRERSANPPPGAPIFVAECARAEYLFVLRTLHESPPKLDADGFEGGLFAGDVLLFRLADGTLLGGFQLRAENSESVQVETDGRGNPVNADERLRSDLSSNVYVAVDRRLRELIPGVLPDRN